MDPYEILANAVILQAVKDYRAETGTAETNPEKAKIIAWIMSENFSAITNVNPVALVEALKKEDKQKWAQ